MDIYLDLVRRDQLHGGCVASSVKNGRENKNVAAGTFTLQLEEPAKPPERVSFMENVLRKTKIWTTVPTTILEGPNVLQVRYLLPIQIDIGGNAST